MQKKGVSHLILKLILLLSITGIPYLWFVGNKIITEDHFYWKTTSKGEHLVIGGSRAQKGISPTILCEELGINGNCINIAFTLVNSPYGTYYNKFINKKIKRTKEKQLFILEANAGLIMDFKEERFAREGDFRIYDLFLINQHPNIEYFIRNSNSTHYSLKQILAERERAQEYNIHKDGWVEFIDQRDTFIPLQNMRIFSHEFSRSQSRENAFVALVTQLADLGNVILVRMPIHEEVTILENHENQFFNELITKVSKKENIYYLDYSEDGARYDFYDFYHHLTGQSAREFSRKLADDIRNITTKF